MRIVRIVLLAAALSFPAAAQNVKSQACDLLTTEEVSEAYRRMSVSVAYGSGDETMGTTNCSYSSELGGGSITLTLLKGEAFDGGTADQKFEGMRKSMSDGRFPFEDLRGVGYKAAMTTLSVANNGYSVLVMKNSAVLSISVTFLEKSAALAVAIIAAGRM